MAFDTITINNAVTGHTYTAYQILKGYYPGLKSNEFKKELSSRARHFTKGYSIRPIEGKDAYVIGNDELSDEQYGLILTIGAHYRFKILPLEEFLLYSDKVCRGREEAQKVCDMQESRVSLCVTVVSRFLWKTRDT